jgi:hypothetical protein
MDILQIPTFDELKNMPSMDHVFFEILNLLEFDFSTKKIKKTFKKKVHEVDILYKIGGIEVRSFLLDNKYIIGLTYEDYVGGLYDLYDYVVLPTGIRLTNEILIKFENEISEMIKSEMGRDYFIQDED